MNRTWIVTTTATVALMMTGAASAVPTGAHWIWVPNAINPITGEPTGLAGRYCTFDLYVDLEPGDTIDTVDFGIAGPNSGISTNGVFFQDEGFGSDSLKVNLEANPLIHELSPALPFDTAVAMNDEVITFANAMNFNEAGVTGAWFPTNHTNLSGPVLVARFTVSIDSLFLGGQLFVSGDGPNGEFGQNFPPSGVVNVPGVLCPAPGAILIVASPFTLGAARRRRPRRPLTNVGAC